MTKNLAVGKLSVQIYDEQALQELRAKIEAMGGSLQAVPVGSVAARLNIHAVLKKIINRIVPLIKIESNPAENFLFDELQQSKSRIPIDIYANLFRSQVKLAQARNSGSYPSVQANRGIVPADQRKRDKTVFYQIFQQVRVVVIRENLKCRLICTLISQIGTGTGKAALDGYSSNDAGKQFWKMTFEGEGGIDAGGLFRDSLREICAELQCEGSLKLLIPFPNQRRMGSGQGKWILNSSLSDGQHLEMYRFLGTMLGASLLREASVELDFPGMFWKQLIGQNVTLGDLMAVDEAFCKKIQDTRAFSAEEWTAMGQSWLVVTSTGRFAELRPGGADTLVDFSQKDAYLDACVEYRLNEGHRQMKAVREGFFELVPQLGLQFVDWQEVEKLVCGTPVIDVAMLKKITSYNNMPGDEEHPVAAMFWRVMEGLSNEDKAQIMAFSWGRRRMPPQVRPHMITRHFSKIRRQRSWKLCCWGARSPMTHTDLISNLTEKSVYDLFFVFEFNRNMNIEMAKPSILFP